MKNEITGDKLNYFLNQFLILNKKERNNNFKEIKDKLLELSLQEDCNFYELDRKNL